VIRLEGTLDGSSATSAQAAIGPELQPGCRLVIDLSEVDYMSSAGLRLMLSIFRQVSGGGGKVAMTGLSEEIQDTMSLTGFLDFFTTADTMDGALQAVRA
jgi:anti-sigma B factor antagonist